MKYLISMIVAATAVTMCAKPVLAQANSTNEVCYHAGRLAKEMHLSLVAGKVDEDWLITRAKEATTPLVSSTIYLVINHRLSDNDAVRRLAVMECTLMVNSLTGKALM